MHCLVVFAHPLKESLCLTLADQVVQILNENGHTVVTQDLCATGFDPSLSASERSSYYAEAYEYNAVGYEVRRLLEAEALVLIFPTWWFGFPAVLKGWFDRVWGPGIAYDHADDYGPIKPRLRRLKRVLAVTTLGAPWWVDRLVMRQPIKRIIKIALLSTCTRKCRFQMASLYKCERLTPKQVKGFQERIARMLKNWV